MSDPIDVSDFLAGYLAEVDDLLVVANGHLLGLEQTPDAAHPRAVRELFRALHTVKGLSAMVGVEPVVALAHVMETVLRAADRAGGRLPAGSPDTLLRGIRAIEQRVHALAEGRPVPVAPTVLVEALEALDFDVEPAAAPITEIDGLDPALVAKLSASEHTQILQAITAGRPVVRADFVPSAARAESGLTITAVRERVAKLGEIVKVLPHNRPASANQPAGLTFILLLVSDAPLEAIAEATGTTAQELVRLGPLAPGPSETLSFPALPALADGELDDDDPTQRSGIVRVAVSRLDDAMARLSALVVNRFRLTRAFAALQARGVDVREVTAIMAETGRNLRDLRAAVVRVRMVPVAELLERVPLLVRGLRRSTGKEVRLELDAGRAELDKAVADRVFPALVHLIRNAMDHGIETTAERRAAGKPAEAVLRVACFERSNTQLELTVSDDGRGIDAARVAARAGCAIPSSEGALLDLLTMPGLTTKDQVTTTSGRGVGMDIVKRIAVSELGGELRLATRPGQGTAFTLRIPLTISIIDAFSFVCGSSAFVAPVSTIEEIVELDAAKIAHGPRRAAGVQSSIGMFERRGETVPLISLESLFGLRPTTSVLSKALVVRRHGLPYAFAIDRMIGQQEVVVRPLEDPLVKVGGVAGATDLGDGRPTLVLDLLDLVSGLAPRLREATS